MKKYFKNFFSKDNLFSGINIIFDICITIILIINYFISDSFKLTGLNKDLYILFIIIFAYSILIRIYSNFKYKKIK